MKPDTNSPGASPVSRRTFAAGALVAGMAGLGASLPAAADPSALWPLAAEIVERVAALAALDEAEAATTATAAEAIRNYVAAGGPSCTEAYRTLIEASGRELAAERCERARQEIDALVERILGTPPRSAADLAAHAVAVSWWCAAEAPFGADPVDLVADTLARHMLTCRRFAGLG